MISPQLCRRWGESVVQRLILAKFHLDAKRTLASVSEFHPFARARVESSSGQGRGSSWAAQSVQTQKLSSGIFSWQSISQILTRRTIGHTETLSSREISRRFLSGVHGSNMFIQTQSTPNPSSLMFFPGKPVMEVGSSDFPNARVAMGSPLAKALFGIDGVTRVFFGADFVTVTKDEEISWDILKPQIFAVIMDFYMSKMPLFYDAQTTAAADTKINEDDDETVAMIKELLETRIRPAVQDDGGDIEFHGFDEDTGIVKLKMQGACSGCPSSSVTLKTGIENMLMHYVPEVKGVEEYLDEDSEDAAASPAG